MDILVVDVKGTGDVNNPYSYTHTLMNIDDLPEDERKLAIEAYQYKECRKCKGLGFNRYSGNDCQKCGGKGHIK